MFLGKLIFLSFNYSISLITKDNSSGLLWDFGNEALSTSWHMLLSEYLVVTGRWSLTLLPITLRLDVFSEFRILWILKCVHFHVLHKTSSRIWCNMLEQIDVYVWKYFCMNFYTGKLAFHHYLPISSSQCRQVSYKKTYFWECLNFGIVIRNFDSGKLKGDSAFSYCELKIILIFMMWCFLDFLAVGPQILFLHPVPQLTPLPFPGTLASSLQISSEN